MISKETMILFKDLATVVSLVVEECALATPQIREKMDDVMYKIEKNMRPYYPMIYVHNTLPKKERCFRTVVRGDMDEAIRQAEEFVNMYSKAYKITVMLPNGMEPVFTKFGSRQDMEVTFE